MIKGQTRFIGIMLRKPSHTGLFPRNQLGGLEMYLINSNYTCILT
jgi:hypothetical protein